MFIQSLTLNQQFKPLLRNWQAILLECSNVPFDGLADVLDGLFLGLALADTARQGGTLSYPIAVFWIDNDLSHRLTSMRPENCHFT
jgi:hypothetical protein